MKKIINGKLYNTDTARVICALDSTENVADHDYHDTCLYQTRKGAFFLAGRGNARSMWAHETMYDGSAPGSGLQVIDKDTARAYMEAAECFVGHFKEAGFTVEEG